MDPVTSVPERRWPSALRRQEATPLPPDDAATSMSPDELVTAHLPLVGYLVNEVASRLPAHVAREDLHSAGLVGLVQAAAAYDASRGVPFRRYASARIRGAMVDELRAGDWVSRATRQRGRRKEEAVAQLSVVLGRVPTQAEVAEFLGCSVSELDRVDDDLHRTALLSLDAAPDPDVLTSGRPDGDPTPEETVLHLEELGYLSAAVDALPTRLGMVIRLYFLQGRPMAEVAASVGVSESRASQLRGEALVLLRDGINSQLDPDAVPVSARPGGCVDRRRAAYFASVAERATHRVPVESGVLSEAAGAGSAEASPAAEPVPQPVGVTGAA